MVEEIYGLIKRDLLVLLSNKKVERLDEMTRNKKETRENSPSRYFFNWASPSWTFSGVSLSSFSATALASGPGGCVRSSNDILFRCSTTLRPIHYVATNETILAAGRPRYICDPADDISRTKRRRPPLVHHLDPIFDRSKSNRRHNGPIPSLSFRVDRFRALCTPNKDETLLASTASSADKETSVSLNRW